MSSSRSNIVRGKKPIESLEPRTMFALIGIASQLGYPQTTLLSVSPTITYNATSDEFVAQDIPFLFTQSPSDGGTIIQPASATAPAWTSTIKLKVGSDGLYDSGISGSDLIVTGSLTLGSNTFDGVLLTGEASPYGAFGFASDGSGFDFRFKVTGGLLKNFFCNRDIGVTLTSEGTNFTGFNSDFSGLPKGFLGPICKPQTIDCGAAATVDWWASTRGQDLIKKFNGAATATNLANWLSVSYPNLYGAASGADVAGMTNADIGLVLKQLRNSGRTDLEARLEAQVLATALSIYATTTSLGGSIGESYGFDVSGGGLNSMLYNIGKNGAAFGAANYSKLSVFQIMSATNAAAVNGDLWSNSLSMQKLATAAFDGLLDAGDCNNNCNWNNYCGGGNYGCRKNYVRTCSSYQGPRC
jgi:hypothetical protein